MIKQNQLEQREALFTEAMDLLIEVAHIDKLLYSLKLISREQALILAEQQLVAAKGLLVGAATWRKYLE